MSPMNSGTSAQRPTQIIDLGKPFARFGKNVAEKWRRLPLSIGHITQTQQLNSLFFFPSAICLVPFSSLFFCSCLFITFTFQPNS